MLECGYKIKLLSQSHLWDYFWVRQQETKQVRVAPIEVGEPGHSEVCVAACLKALGPD